MAAPIAEGKKKSIIKPLVIIIIVVLLLLITAVGLFLFKDKINISSIRGSKVEEHTVLLNEFIVNVQSNNTKKSYLKVQMALMYTDKKGGEVIEANINKIRDIIIKNLLDESSTEILETEKLAAFKEDIKDSINKSLDKDLIDDIYITDIVLQ